jgi:hypothetical protein
VLKGPRPAWYVQKPPKDCGPSRAKFTVFTSGGNIYGVLEMGSRGGQCGGISGNLHSETSRDQGKFTKQQNQSSQGQVSRTPQEPMVTS